MASTHISNLRKQAKLKTSYGSMPIHQHSLFLVPVSYLLPRSKLHAHSAMFTICTHDSFSLKNTEKFFGKIQPFLKGHDTRRRISHSFTAPLQAVAFSLYYAPRIAPHVQQLNVNAAIHAIMTRRPPSHRYYSFSHSSLGLVHKLYTYHHQRNDTATVQRSKHNATNDTRHSTLHFRAAFRCLRHCSQVDMLENSDNFMLSSQTALWPEGSF